MDHVYSELRQKTIEVTELRKKLIEKDELIAELSSQLDKYRSIFRRQLTSGSTSSNGGTGSTNSRILSWGPSENVDIGDPKCRARGLGISAEPKDDQGTEDVELIKVPKSNRSQGVIRRAILENEFMRQLHTTQIQCIIDCMQPIKVAANSRIIQEGEVGSTVYVLETGTLTVSKNGKILREISKETVFGELAILYNCTRTATVIANDPCELWSIDRVSFQTIMMKTAMIRQNEILKFLKSVPNFQCMEEEKLQSIVDSLVEMRYDCGEYIIRQGGRGDTFYIISSGKVKVTKCTGTNISGDKEKFIRFMHSGDWFGEKALENEDVRTANIIAESEEGVCCLVLDREAYISLIGGSTFKKYYQDEVECRVENNNIFMNISMNEFEKVAILGVGGFGRVELVKLNREGTQSFAMKRMKKAHIVKTRQQEHVMNERNVLYSVNCPFIVKLYQTYKDAKYLYMVMEVCLGGELWTLLRDRRKFDENTTRFYVASVIEALSYLHEKLIVYRDLKPENLMVDTTGYIKLTDFGFAKKIPLGRKTWTFCGTPEYVAPEIILNKGHDFAADFWSLGILIYELLTGIPPFYANDPMKVYNLILKGVDVVLFDKTSRASQNLIRRLCRDNPADRFGYGQEGIRVCQKHIWFESFNWDGLVARSLEAPIVPTIRSATDFSNFDFYPDNMSDTEEDMSGWDKAF